MEEINNNNADNSVKLTRENSNKQSDKNAVKTTKDNFLYDDMIFPS